MYPMPSENRTNCTEYIWNRKKKKKSEVTNGAERPCLEESVGLVQIPNLEFSRCVRPGTHPDERVNNEVYSCLEQENSTIFLQRERLHLHVLILDYHIQRSTWCVKKGKGPPNLQNNSLKSRTAI